MATLPPELWHHILSPFGTADVLANSSTDAWARIATNTAINIGKPSRVVAESNKTKRVFGLVSRRFYELSRPITLEVITLREIDSLRYLVSRLSKKPEFAGMMNRYTKRINVEIDGPSFGNISASALWFKQLLEYLEVVLRTCTNLTYFSYRSDRELDFTLGKFGDTLRRSCPLLAVLRYNIETLLWVELRLVLPRFAKLRVLDLSTSCTVRCSEDAEHYELPYLHTLIGPVDFICERFRSVILPALHTLICKPRAINTFRDVVDADVCTSIQEFFRCHGESIRSIDVRYGHFNTLGIWDHLQNVTECVLPTDLSSFMATELLGPFPQEDMRSVQTIGLFADCPDDMKEEVSEMAEFALAFIDEQRQVGFFANLRTVRILDDQLVLYLRRRKRMVMQLLERRLRGWSIQIEDGYGKVFVPRSS